MPGREKNAKRNCTDCLHAPQRTYREMIFFRDQVLGIRYYRDQESENKDREEEHISHFLDIEST